MRSLCAAQVEPEIFDFQRAFIPCCVGLTESGAAKAKNCTLLTPAGNARRSTNSELRAGACPCLHRLPTFGHKLVQAFISEACKQLRVGLRQLRHILEYCAALHRRSRLTFDKRKALSVHHPSVNASNLGYHDTFTHA